MDNLRPYYSTRQAFYLVCRHFKPLLHRSNEVSLPSQAVSYQSEALSGTFQTQSMRAHSAHTSYEQGYECSRMIR